jgi:hypothetical protein
MIGMTDLVRAWDHRVDVERDGSSFLGGQEHQVMLISADMQVRCYLVQLWIHMPWVFRDVRGLSYRS